MDSIETTEEQPLDLPRYRINMKQTSKGLHYADCTVELRTPTVEWVDQDGKKAQLGPAEIMADLLKRAEDAVQKAGGTMARYGATPTDSP